MHIIGRGWLPTSCAQPCWSWTSNLYHQCLRFNSSNPLSVCKPRYLRWGYYSIGQCTMEDKAPRSSRKAQGLIWDCHLLASPLTFWRKVIFIIWAFISLNALRIMVKKKYVWRLPIKLNYVVFFRMYDVLNTS